MIRPEAKAAFLQLLDAMQKESERMAKDFEREPGQNYQSKDVVQQAIAAIASKQAAMCTMLKLLIEGEP